MKTKIVYCVCSTNEDFYTEQTVVSIYSLKKNSPNTYTVVLVDQQTFDNFTDARKKALSIADEVKVIDVGDGSGYYRSRMLRTTVREHITGSVLSLDSDTIILRPLDKLDEITDDIAAVQDANLPFFSKLHPSYNRSVSHCNKYFNFPLQNEPKYFSGGAIFTNDTPAAHEFYKEWNKHFIEGHKLGVIGDQQSLAYTNYLKGHPIVEISGIWNCQMGTGVRFMPQAHILHYFSWARRSNNKEEFVNPLKDPKTYESVKKTGEISCKIAEIVNNPSLMFCPQSTMVSGDMFYLMRTRTFNALLYIYHYRKIFNVIDSIMSILYRLFAKEKKLSV